MGLFRHFVSSSKGSATVEFALLFPLFMGIFATGFEAGLFMTRSVMLERSVDIVVRDVRLGGTDLPDLKGLKEEICDNVLVLPNCVNSLQVQLEPIPVNPGAINAVNGPVRCIDKMSQVDPSTATNYGIGVENEMMIVKVCALVKPMFPASRLGLGMQVDKALGLPNDGDGPAHKGCKAPLRRNTSIAVPKGALRCRAKDCRMVGQGAADVGKEVGPLG